MQKYKKEKIIIKENDADKHEHFTKRIPEKV